MKITNSSDKDVLCNFDGKTIELKKGENVEIEHFDFVRFAHNYTSYSTGESGDSKVLKFLSIIDDPFKLRKEYHIVVDYEISHNMLSDSKQIVITSNTFYMDVETRTYYEYFVVETDGKMTSPNQIYVSELDHIMEDFIENSRKLTRWNSVWDVFIEPILLECIAYFTVYKLLSFWIGSYAWFVVVPLIALNILVECIIWLFKSKNKRVNKFLHYVDECVIYETCYKMKN